MKNKFSTFLSISSLLVSSLALVISYQASLDRRENLKVSMARSPSQDAANIRAPIDNLPPLVSTNWEVIIANTSDRKTTVLDYEIYYVDDTGERPSHSFGEDFYFLNGEALLFPISIEPGEYLKIGANIHYEISSLAYTLLNESFDLNSPQSFEAVRKTLCKHEIDVLGNLADCAGSKVRIDWTSDKGLYVLKLKTARDNYFHAAGDWYSFSHSY